MNRALSTIRPATAQKAKDRMPSVPPGLLATTSDQTVRLVTQPGHAHASAVAKSTTRWQTSGSSFLGIEFRRLMHTS